LATSTRAERLERTDARPDQAVAGGRPSRAFAWTVGALRLPIVALLVAAAVASVRYLPGVSSLPDAGVRALLPANTPAERAEAESARLFGSSLLARTAVVQRDPAGLSPAAQRRTVRFALRLDQDRLPRFPRGSRALPYLNTRGMLPGSRESSTAAITYLAFPSSLSPQDQRKYADRYAGALSRPGAPAYATGFVPGSVTQSIEVAHGLRWVEIASVLLVAAILGLYLRSVLAPLVTLAAAGIAYAISIGVVSWLSRSSGVHLDREVEPIVVVLLLGVVTDYSVFFLAGMRGRLAEGEGPREAASRATADVVPIVFTAGLLVAAGLATLRLAGIGFVQTLGPAMAVVVLVSLGVSIALVPAAMRIFGRALFWPGLRGDGADRLAGRVGSAVRRVVAGGASGRPVAVLVAVSCSACSRSPRGGSSRPGSRSRRSARCRPRRRRPGVPPRRSRDSRPGWSRRPSSCSAHPGSPRAAARCRHSAASSRLGRRSAPSSARARPSRGASRRRSARAPAAPSAGSSPSATTRTAPPTSAGSRARCRRCSAAPASPARPSSSRATRRSRARRSTASTAT
jgi:hypothetical protein